jgi:hypothetical protein
MVGKRYLGTVSSIMRARMRVAGSAQPLTGSLCSFGAEFQGTRSVIIIGPSFAISGCLNRRSVESETMIIRNG